MNINGKEVPVRLYGDEYSKHIENEEGYTIVQDKKGVWYYAVLDNFGHLIPSAFKMGDNSAELRQLLLSMPYHLSESVSLIKRENMLEPQRQPVVGQRRMLIILMEFPDKKFVKTKRDFDNLFNQVDYNEDGAQGSVRDFFYQSSYGQLVLSCDVYGPYETTNRMSTYGLNSVLGGGDKNPRALFEEAIESVSSEIDLNAYDGDNDGYIDNVHIVYAGYGEEAGGPSTAIWAHEATFSQPYEIQGLKIDRYSCAPELRGNSGEGISRIGPHCHEIGHALGAMDFYDTNYSDDGLYDGTGEWDLMAAGSWNNDGITPADVNPYVKIYCYGWADAHTLPKGYVIIPPSDMGKDGYYVISHGKESYYLENRNPHKNSDGLPGKGLLLFHVHSDIENAENEINVTSPQKCYVVCASANSDIPKDSSKDYGFINSDGCPFPGSSNKTEFSNTSVPAAFWWTNDDCSISLHDIEITRDGSINLYNDSNESEAMTTIYSESFFDGFETPKDYLVIFSSQSYWERVKSSGLVDMVSGRPLAYEGDYCLQLEAQNRSDNSVSSIGFQCKFASNVNSLILSGFFISKGLNRGLINHLKIGWRPPNSDKWNYYDYEVPVNDVWTPFLLRIAPSLELEFSIEGIAQGGSVLALDNLKIEQQIITDLYKSISYSTAEGNEILGLSGSRRKRLSKGLNIVRYRDGTIRKILVK